MLEINGDILEGGGQILRTSLALSSILNRPIFIKNIRAKRPKPGLKAQHFTGFKVMSEFTNALIDGLDLNSHEIKFIPRGFYPQDKIIDIKTAGSIGLLLQVILLPLTLKTDKKINLKIKGGTHVMKAIPIDYYINLICPILKKIGVKINITLINQGYYPKGGGEVDVEIYAWPEKKHFSLIERGEFLMSRGISHASLELKKANVAERQMDSAYKILTDYFPDIEIEIKYFKSLSPGSGIVLWAEYENAILGADALGERGKPAEEVGREAAEKLLKEINSNACCDVHMADNLIPWLAFSKGRISVSEISLHTQTNIWVVEQFLGKIFKVENNIISVE